MLSAVEDDEGVGLLLLLLSIVVQYDIGEQLSADLEETSENLKRRISLFFSFRAWYLVPNADTSNSLLPRELEEGRVVKSRLCDEER